MIVDLSNGNLYVMLAAYYFNYITVVHFHSVLCSSRIPGVVLMHNSMVRVKIALNACAYSSRYTRVAIPNRGGMFQYRFACSLAIRYAYSIFITIPLVF